MKKRHEHNLKCLREVGGRLVCVEESGRRVRLREETTAERFAHAKDRANEGLHALGYNVYHQDPRETYKKAVEIVESQGFDVYSTVTQRFYDDSRRAVVDATMNGRTASLSFSWHKMPSGRYEIVAYLS